MTRFGMLVVGACLVLNGLLIVGYVGLSAHNSAPAVATTTPSPAAALLASARRASLAAAFGREAEKNSTAALAMVASLESDVKRMNAALSSQRAVIDRLRAVLDGIIGVGNQASDGAPSAESPTSSPAAAAAATATPTSYAALFKSMHEADEENISASAIDGNSKVKEKKLHQAAAVEPPRAPELSTLFLVISHRRHAFKFPAIHKRMAGRDYLIIVGRRRGDGADGGGSSSSSSSSSSGSSSSSSSSSSHVSRLRPASSGPRVWEVDADDRYEGLPEKVIAAYRAALEYKPGLRFVVKQDDDMVVRPTAFDLSAALANKNKVDYLGCVSDAPGNPSWHQQKVTPGSPWANKSYTGLWTPYSMGGFGYLLSRRALQVLAAVATPSRIQEDIYEDLMVGKLLGEAGIEPHPCCCSWQAFVSSSHHDGTEDITRNRCSEPTAHDIADAMAQQTPTLGSADAVASFAAGAPFSRLETCTETYTAYSARVRALADVFRASEQTKT